MITRHSCLQQLPKLISIKSSCVRAQPSSPTSRSAVQRAEQQAAAATISLLKLADYFPLTSVKCERTALQSEAGRVWHVFQQLRPFKQPTHEDTDRGLRRTRVEIDMPIKMIIFTYHVEKQRSEQETWE